MVNKRAGALPSEHSHSSECMWRGGGGVKDKKDICNLMSDSKRTMKGKKSSIRE